MLQGAPRERVSLPQARQTELRLREHQLLLGASTPNSCLYLLRVFSRAPGPRAWVERVSRERGRPSERNRLRRARGTVFIIRALSIKCCSENDKMPTSSTKNPIHRGSVARDLRPLTLPGANNRLWSMYRTASFRVFSINYRIVVNTMKRKGINGYGHRPLLNSYPFKST